MQLYLKSLGGKKKTLGITGSVYKRALLNKKPSSNFLHRSNKGSTKQRDYPECFLSCELNKCVYGALENTRLKIRRAVSWSLTLPVFSWVCSRFAKMPVGGLAFSKFPPDVNECVWSGVWSHLTPQFSLRRLQIRHDSDQDINNLLHWSTDYVRVRRKSLSFFFVRTISLILNSLKGQRWCLLFHWFALIT